MSNNKKHDTGAKSLKVSADTLLGMDKGMDKEILRTMRETLSQVSEKSGEVNALKVLDSMSSALNTVKDEQLRLIILSNLLAPVKLSRQMVFVKEHEKIVREAAKINFTRNMRDNHGLIDRLLEVRFDDIL